jgi:hypothetical protein
MISRFTITVLIGLALLFLTIYTVAEDWTGDHVATARRLVAESEKLTNERWSLEIAAAKAQAKAYEATDPHAAAAAKARVAALAARIETIRARAAELAREADEEFDAPKHTLKPWLRWLPFGE